MKQVAVLKEIGTRLISVYTSLKISFKLSDEFRFEGIFSYQNHSYV